MKTQKCIKLTMIALLAISVGLTAFDIRAFAKPITPYNSYTDPSEFYCGATFDLRKTIDTKGYITRNLEQMKTVYNINTITVYSLDSLEDTYKDWLFDELKRLGMKIVVRIEAYDENTFEFTDTDLSEVMQRYEQLIEYVSAKNRKGQVAYFALNMPVDNGHVMQRLGGINSQLSADRQVSYAAAFVKAMRRKTASYGFTNAKMYLSVFYGWDNTYKIPSYAKAGADGYFINNYSYPKSKVLGTESDGESLINAERLSISMETFKKQYGNAPFVIESGFHTLEYNNGKKPNQTAGLVADTKAKQKALSATLEFYKDNYPNIRGWLYFGYNLFKTEGNPPAVMDWSLVYPSEGLYYREDCTPLKNGGFTVVEAPVTQQVVLNCKSVNGAEISFLSGGELIKTITIPPLKDYTAIGTPLTVVQGYGLDIAVKSGSADIEWIQMNDSLYTEYADDNDNGTYTFTGVRGGDIAEVRYKAKKDTRIKLETDGKVDAYPLKASDDFITVKLIVSLARGADFSLTLDPKTIEIEYIKLSGAPVPPEAAALSTPAPAASVTQGLTPTQTPDALSAVSVTPNADPSEPAQTADAEPTASIAPTGTFDNSSAVSPTTAPISTSVPTISSAPDQTSQTTNMNSSDIPDKSNGKDNSAVWIVVAVCLIAAAASVTVLMVRKFMKGKR